jgi:drug/metabolite transporter (DMT)-like permease
LIVVALSLCSAAAYGLSDFLGGLFARRANVWAVAAASQGTAAIMTALLVVLDPRGPAADALAWGIVGGVGSGAGNVLIYRGLAQGRMAVVAPISAIAAAALPVLVGFATGERPALIAGIGVVLALPAIWLVSGGGAGLRQANRDDAVAGLLAGLGFGVQFSALGQVPQDAGLTPLAVSQVVSVASIVIGAAAISERWFPQDRFGRLGAVAGILAGIATICFQLAVQSGMLTIAGVLASLYPAITVLLAALVLREPVQRTQGIGLGLGLAAVALIAAS